MDKSEIPWRRVAVGAMIILVLMAILMNRPRSGNGGHTGPKNQCANNLRLIDAAKEQWTLETSQTNGTIVVTNAINAYLKGDTTPRCPERGVYTYGRVGEKPSCSIPTHSGVY